MTTSLIASGWKRAPSRDELRRQVEAARINSMRTTKSSRPLIMVADHDEDERCLLRAILKLKGFNVIEARDGQETIDLPRGKRPDPLGVDLTLPRVSGAAAI